MPMKETMQVPMSEPTQAPMKEPTQRTESQGSLKPIFMPMLKPTEQQMRKPTEEPTKQQMKMPPEQLVMNTSPPPHSSDRLRMGGVVTSLLWPMGIGWRRRRWEQKQPAMWHRIGTRRHILERNVPERFA